MFSRISAQQLAALSLVITATIGSAMAQQNVPAAPQPLNPALNGDYLRTSQILGVPTSFCGHVIDLMMNVRHLQSAGKCCFDEQLHLPHLSVGLNPGDLELLGVQLVCDGCAEKGPVFQIDMKNNSAVPIGNFRVSVVGVLCQINPHSPCATVCVPRMEPGCCTQIQVQLPVTCMSMCANGQTTGFDTLIVALDSFDDLMECNEVNNLLIVKRCDVVLVTQVNVESEAVPPGPGPAGTAPASPSVPAPQLRQAPQSAPQDTTPLDRIDVEQLNPGNADTSAFIAR